MLPTIDALRRQLHMVIEDRERQGHVVEGLSEELDDLGSSYDAHAAFAERLADLPLRDDWSYVEPNDLEGIWAECAPDRPLGAIAEVDLDDSALRVETAFLSSVAGCVLGKPLEIRPTLAQIRAALESIGEWPMRDYISEAAGDALPRWHTSWPETVRERIRYVAPDDDINYTIMGMLLLEEHGLGFTSEHVRDAWLRHLPIGTTFGPERTLLVKAGMASREEPEVDELPRWVNVLNPEDEKCGALIRADAFGYALPGRPALAAELAWRDASWTHRRTGIYGEMFVAAAIATAQVTDDPFEVFEVALQFVPQRSRFHEIAADSLEDVRQASEWLDGYQRIHSKYERFGHCLIYQEVGTLMNTLRFAEDIGSGICIQVSQGNDTDSFGATAGSLLGAFFGPGHLEERWLTPFNDDIHTALAWFYERSLSTLARRMSELPRRAAEELAAVEG